MGPIAMDIVNQLDIGMIEVAAWDLIGFSMVIPTHLDDHQIRRLFS